ncbi:MAG: biotin-dependent carboxyltransferase family protein [Devosia sp.]|uniref:5-oxoprolinase subunit C family protein n=1 Tax=Devosia sp. TaxID=1871048 RepID=UPI0024C58AC3|nr:biotin-dependent carboxyltransferase family protein [Devosia sp.]UYO00128.1 MAG: biotin-dependent carboxyltransferase family protein [Devosia sp.]
MTRLRIERASPLATIQDKGRFGQLAQGISASGPMDEAAYRRAGLMAGSADHAAIEFTRAGLDMRILEGEVRLAWDGGQFLARSGGEALPWPGYALFRAGDRLGIAPGPAGNYGYLRFGAALDLAPVLGSRATNSRAGFGGLDGRALLAGDELVLTGPGVAQEAPEQPERQDGPLRFIWGIHADRFTHEVRTAFLQAQFDVTTMMDRMGVRLADRAGVFAGASILSLVSDPVLPGDIQILGDGTPIILMRDHQPTGGYPRIGTIIPRDLDRFAQVRPGGRVTFEPVSVDHAHRIMEGRA